MLLCYVPWWELGQVFLLWKVTLIFHGETLLSTKCFSVLVGCSFVAFHVIWYFLIKWQWCSYLKSQYAWYFHWYFELDVLLLLLFGHCWDYWMIYSWLCCPLGMLAANEINAETVWDRSDILFHTDAFLAFFPIGILGLWFAPSSNAFLGITVSV